ncbi:MAG: hypothetical protein QXT28_06930 [Thermofilaceae archaeon]
MSDLIILFAFAVCFTAAFEVLNKSWLGVFAWISWWLMSLQWMSEGSWHLSLLPFAVGLIYFIRVLANAVKPETVRRMLREGGF